MLYGTIKSTTITDGNQETDIEHYSESYKQYRIRVKVFNAQDEMSEFIKFTDEVQKQHDIGKLAVIREDPSTHPAFIIQYPKKNLDNSYFIYKQYCVLN